LIFARAAFIITLAGTPRRAHTINPGDEATIEQALNLPYTDFEDAVQMMAAVQAGAQYLVTRNVQDYKAGPLPALQPAELLDLVG